MYIESLKIQNIRGLKKAQVNFCSGVNLLVGVNGVGKSSILDAVAYSLSHLAARLKSSKSSGKSIPPTDITAGKSEAHIEANFVDSSVETPITLVLASTKPGHAKNRESIFKNVLAWAASYQQKRADRENVSYPLLAHYKVNRAILDIPQRQAKLKNLDEPLSGYDAAFDGGGNFRSFFAWFREMEDLEMEQRNISNQMNYKLPELEAVRKALAVVMPDITDIRVRRKHQAMVATKNGVEISIAQLSDGEKCYLALVGDIACRMARLNSLCQKSADDILHSEGIVLIDELDLHLHPKWQREAIRFLPKIFPKIQFIISTHSLMLLRELTLMQCCPDSNEKTQIKFFSLYKTEKNEIEVEASEQLDTLKNFVAADLQLEQDSQLLSCYGYEL